MIGYPSGQDGAILPAWDTGFVPKRKFIMFWGLIPYNKSFIEQAHVGSRWLDIGLILVFACLWTSSWSINTPAKKNLANIQPSRPHVWSITHIYTSLRSGLELETSAPLNCQLQDSLAVKRISFASLKQ